MENSRLNYKKFYAKQLKSGVVTMRIDDLTSQRLLKISNITSKSRSEIIREALWELFSTKYPQVI
jgi:predicted transcriptional regulator